MIHYLIGFICLAGLLWIIIQAHNYLSKDNIPIGVIQPTANK